MKKLFTILFVFAALGSQAQFVYNNEWINFSQTYYKFRVAANGLYRIPQSVLASAGLGNVPVQNFQLFRNGIEVPIYTTAASGTTMGSSDYIEFWGLMNDGKVDKGLYLNPSYQLSDQWSLETDTSVYFLTVNQSGATFHYSNIANDTAGNILPVEPYFMYRAGTAFKQIINPGYAQVVGENLYSSSYDIGEGWTTDFVFPTQSTPPLVDVQNNLDVYTGGPTTATFRFGAVGAADDNRMLQISVNNSMIVDTAMNNYDELVSSEVIPLSLISSGTASVSIQQVCAANVSDLIAVGFYDYYYPRQFNFNNLADFFFELAPRPAGFYLNITNFNAGAGTPVLYDLTNGGRYTAIMGGGTLYFELPGSSAGRKMVLVSEDPSNVNTVTGLITKNFVNFASASNQGNYLIISNPLLYSTGTGTDNPVQDYKTYRSSAAGGGYNPTVVDINELIDQFAFGISIHPFSIRNYLSYARNNFAVKPQFALLIGHGITYDQYRLNNTDPYDFPQELVPTFGYPGSDNKLSSADVTQAVPVTPIGRLSVISGAELSIYLEKIKEYESTQQTAANTIAGRGWMKNVVHVTGASDPYLGEVLCNYMSNYQQIIQDTLFGANVTTFCKATPTDVEQIDDQELNQLFTTGFSMLTYFGHSSSSTLEYNLNTPASYNNQGKYPVFYVNGCDAGDIFVYNDGRIITPAGSQTLSESYILASERGSIAFVASTSFGIVNYLNILLNGLYNLISVQDYGKPIGISQQDALQNLINAAPGDFFARIHAEQMTLHGDPAVKLNQSSLPDYDVEPQNVLINPTFVSVADTNFTVKAYLLNIGKAVNDSILVTIIRTYPNGTMVTLLQKKIPPILYEDSVAISVPIVPTRDQGQNYITVSVNIPSIVTEVTMANNTVKEGIYIYADELKPIYPYNFSIVNTAAQQLFASTADPLAPSMQYILQIDTTQLFNSAQLVTKTVTSVGGVLQFNPGISYRDSTVYYWRVSVVPAPGSAYHWDQFSFIYIPSSTPGFNQSHYYQQQSTTDQTMYLDSATRRWFFTTINNTLDIHAGVYPTAASQATDYNITIDGNTDSINSVCGISGIIFNVFNPISFKPMLNSLAGQPGRFGSIPTCGSDREYNFQFNILDTGSRRAIVNFMNMLPNGSYVVVRNISGTDSASNTYASTWAGDTSYLGSGVSMYNLLLLQGFTGIDSFNRPRAFIFTYQKNDQLIFPPEFVFSQGIYDKIELDNSNYITPDTTGTITSPQFGPAEQWKQLHWSGYSLETPSTDSVSVQIFGIDTLNNVTPLQTVGLANQDYDISSINAKQYPYLQLQMKSTDDINATPYQLKYWMLNYAPVPEGAIAPNLYLTSKDTLSIGDNLEFAVAFKNVSPTNFDSMQVKMTVTDHNNAVHIITIPKKKALLSGDTLIVAYELNTKNYPGLNTLYLDVNPNNDQPEQFLFNNFMYKTFYVKPDVANPLLDVSFDGVHILNQDIVSAKPHILIKLTSESKLLLQDTSLVKVQIRYPDGSLHEYTYTTDTLHFTPATNPATNVASVDFYPAFTKQYNPQGDLYTLYVTGKDESGNPAGTVQYQISFTVITKPMISNMLNYPNPFTTSTAFVFTITGSQVPQNIRIEIMTITGKVIKEITEEELGPLHVGTNITQYKWNGTDMYGQRVANGVYLYRVVTNLNGKALDKYTPQGDNTNQFFTNGYGKMYLMK